MAKRGTGLAAETKEVQLNYFPYAMSVILVPDRSDRSKTESKGSPD